MGQEADRATSLSDDDIETVARAMHDRYVRERVEIGETAEDNGSLVAWEDLPGPLRESNRSFARGIEEKLGLVGWELSAGAPDEEGAGFVVTPAEVETLAPPEHARWRRDLETDGWVHGPDRDPGRRMHPMLVGWEKLPEVEREKDREAVRWIPALLAAAGYSVTRSRRAR